MKRQVFYSFQYKPDCWRASKIRNIGVIEGNRPATDNDWESVTRGGDSAIAKWVEEQLHYRSCTVVLIGENTANRKWINHEIIRSWNENMGLLGIYVHNIWDADNSCCRKGPNPFSYITHDGNPLSTIVNCYDPPYSQSKDVYAYISENIGDWVESALDIRARYSPFIRR